MVYVISAWGQNGFIISAEDNSMYVCAKDIKINVPIETKVNETFVNENVVFSGKIQFETNNDIVIKEKIVYIN